jgi:hypothetical protein
MRWPEEHQDLLRVVLRLRRIRMATQTALLEGRNRVTKKQLKNYITFVLDGSGSMLGIAGDAKKTYNALIDKIREESRSGDQETRVGLFRFNTRVEKVYIDANVETLQPLSSYGATGGTALFDAVGAAVEASRSMRDAGEAHVSHLLMIITDGEENSSTRYKARQIKDLIEELDHDGNWSFIFQVPPGFKHKFVRDFGIPEGNVREWEATRQGVQYAEEAAVAGFSHFYASRSAGQTKVADFFVKTDLSSLKPEEIKKKLVDVQRDYMSITVSREMDIKQFVEENTNQAYKIGSTFYQLSKTEKVQAAKEVLLMEKGKRAIWGGRAARQLIGLPDNGDAKVVPGNHSDYDIFVLSTSNNRKLVRGTKVLVRK